MLGPTRSEHPDAWRVGFRPPLSNSMSQDEWAGWHERHTAPTRLTSAGLSRSPQNSAIILLLPQLRRAVSSIADRFFRQVSPGLCQHSCERATVIFLYRGPSRLGLLGRCWTEEEACAEAAADGPQHPCQAPRDRSRRDHAAGSPLRHRRGASLDPAGNLMFR